jgi:sporulation protein YlmC with PRC-barrel domain
MDVMGYGGFLGGSLVPAPTAESMTREKKIDDAQRRKNDPNLRSVKEVIGYHIHASDGEIGHVEDLLIEDDDWSIHYFVVETNNWWPGNKVLISPLSVQSIQWSDRLVNLKINRQKVKDGRAFDPSAKINPISKKNIHKPNSDFRVREES